MRGQRDLRLARQTQSGRPTPFDHQFHRRRGLRHFYLHETRRRLAPVPALPPATKGGVMDTLPAGKIGSGQPAAIKRPQKLSAPGGIGPRRAASLRNTTLLHDRGFITARWQLIGEPCCTAYVQFYQGGRGKKRRKSSGHSGRSPLGAGQTHGIKRLVCIIEAGGQKALLGVFAEDRVAAQGIMHRDVHDVAPIKTEPADRTD